MAKHRRIRSDEQRKRLDNNREKLLSTISGHAKAPLSSTQSASITLMLERFVTNRAHATPVPYEGPVGVEQLLIQLSQTYALTKWVDGHLVSVGGTLLIEGIDEPIELEAKVGMGGQLGLTVGPSSSIAHLINAVHVFDRHMHLACVELKLDYELTAQGYNPYIVSPSDIVPVPLRSFALLGAYLSRTGRFTRDALRCTAATHVMLPMDQDEQQSTQLYRLFSALAPLLSFLTDNSLSLRGADPYESPHMVRSLVWDQLDANRCGLVAGTFGPHFGYQAYERWIEGVRPIVFTSDSGVTFSCGSDTFERVMEERDLSGDEIARLLSAVYPDVRWDGHLTLCMADSLSIRLVAGYLALIKGITGNDSARAAALELMGVEGINDSMVSQAWHSLREQGWQARIYGKPAAQIAHELVSIASRNLEDTAERRMLEALAQLWEIRLVPRDLLIKNWERSLEPTPEQEAIELYGEGAVIPYDDLVGEPPAGQTSVMHIPLQG